MTSIFRGFISSINTHAFLAILGVFSGWIISDYYYEKALTDQKAGEAELRKMFDLIFLALEKGGTVTYSRDASGKVVGVVMELKGGTTADTIQQVI
jgi:hypothetical protein